MVTSQFPLNFISISSIELFNKIIFLIMGIFSITQIEFNLSVFAAILAVIGYSLNDTIVGMAQDFVGSNNISQARAMVVTVTSSILS